MISKWKKNFRFEVKIHEYRNLFVNLLSYITFIMLCSNQILYLLIKRERREEHTQNSNTESKELYRMKTF